MQRVSVPVRPQWRERVREVGLTFHTLGGETYWHEGVAYAFTLAEADAYEDAANELHRLCLLAVDAIVRQGRFAEFAIPEAWWPALQRSWEVESEAHLYGRFDLVPDVHGVPRMLEYNADTPTALLEASVVEWQWLDDLRRLHPSAVCADQFNSIHEQLQQRFRILGVGPWAFAGELRSVEDAMTLAYLQDVAAGVGCPTTRLGLADIGWNGRCFTDLEERRLTRLFKLYPWEWLLRDAFAQHLDTGGMQVVEPLWKLLLSSKAILPVLWELFPGHPHLLRAARTPWSGTVVRKPLYSREGANITISDGTRELAASGGAYGDDGWIWQEACPLPDFAGNRPVIGAWMVGDTACGLGIREDDGPITTDRSRFVPHFLM